MDYIDKYKQAQKSNFSSPEANKARKNFYLNVKLDIARAHLRGWIADKVTPPKKIK